MYAIVRSGGKQYKVAKRTVFLVEKLDVEDGATVDLTDILLVADGENVTVGDPVVSGAVVTARVLGTAKGKKVNGFTYKPKKGIQRHYGHRQWHTQLIVENITA